MSLAILFYFLCAQHVSDINVSIIRSLQLCCWVTTLVVLFLFHCVLDIWCGWVWVVPMLQAEAQLVIYQLWWVQWPFWFVPSVPGYLREEEEHKPDPWRNPIERNHMGLHLENEVYCVWQDVNTPTIILNNPVFWVSCFYVGQQIIRKHDLNGRLFSTEFVGS